MGDVATMKLRTLVIHGTHYQPFEQLYDARLEGFDPWLRRVLGQQKLDVELSAQRSQQKQEAALKNAMGGLS